ncbi:acyltransferase family protein [Candidatus Frankia nodulisporulans]|uniref:acyltransferase family protein n=1 Tax=Candidatus Frankia nodulisporulans TaxID=2060052 RepID=UPI001CDCD974|nr:acyltransferase [Candidatus Frankia nodulisporulans]
MTAPSHRRPAGGSAGHRADAGQTGQATQAAQDTQDTQAAAKFAYHPALDGIRVICIYVILAGHMGAIRASNVAVDVFFVLSGFLITALLLAEHHRTGTVSIGRFLVRRAFRLMPAMWVYLFVGLLVTALFKWDDTAFRDDFVGSATSVFFNVNNWYKVAHPEAGGRWLAHVWSLSLEEQFYLLWPVMFVLVRRSARLRRHLGLILLGLVLMLAGWTYVLASDGAPHTRVYLALDTHVAPLLIGCLLAVWRDTRLRALSRAEDLAPPVPPTPPPPLPLPSTPPGPSGRPVASTWSVARAQGHRRHASRPRTGSDSVTGATAASGANAGVTGGHGAGAGRPDVTAAVVRRWPAGRRVAALGLAAAIGLVLFAFLGPNKNVHAANWLDRAAYLPSALLAAIVVLSADLRRDAAWVRLLGRPRMASLGKMTFSVYLWHYPVISAANGQLVPRIGLWPAVVCAAAASTFVAYFSHRLIERPAQRMRPGWADTPRGPRRTAVAVAEPFAHPAERRVEDTAGLRWRWESADEGRPSPRAGMIRTGEDTLALRRGGPTRSPELGYPWSSEPETDDVWVDEGYARIPVGYASHAARGMDSHGDVRYADVQVDPVGAVPGPPAPPAYDHRWSVAGWDPVTGPSRLPADPAYVDEVYTGELIVAPRETGVPARVEDPWYSPRGVSRRPLAG